MFEFARIVLVLIVGIVIGWGVCIWRNGLNINPFAANESAQSAVNAAVESSAKINAGERESSAAAARVRLVIKTVEVDRECPPGRGPVSGDVAERLRVAMAQASGSADKPSASVRTGGNSAMRANQY